MRFLVILVLLLASLSCTKQYSYDKYMNYLQVSENNLLIEKTLNGINFKLLYRPSNLLVYQHNIAKSNRSKEEIKKLKKDYSKQINLMLSISDNEKEAIKQIGSASRYSNVLSNVAFRMDHYVTLTNSKRDTLPLLDFHFGRTFGYGQSNDVILVFQKEITKPDDLILHIKEFGLQTGNTRFYLPANAIRKAQRIKIKN